MLGRGVMNRQVGRTLVVFLNECFGDRVANEIENLVGTFEVRDGLESKVGDARDARPRDNQRPEFGGITFCSAGRHGRSERMRNVRCEKQGIYGALEYTRPAEFCFLSGSSNDENFPSRKRPSASLPAGCSRGHACGEARRFLLAQPSCLVFQKVCGCRSYELDVPQTKA